MFTILGFAAQVCVICIAFALFVDMHGVVSSEHSALVSAASLPQSKVPLPHPVVSPNDELYIIDDNSDESDATLSDSTSYSAKSMMSSVITTTISDDVIADDLSCLTIRQLKALCRERGIKRYSSLRKHELLALLA